jgi:iron complex outermembrane recepter protein
MTKAACVICTLVFVGLIVPADRAMAAAARDPAGVAYYSSDHDQTAQEPSPEVQKAIEVLKPRSKDKPAIGKGVASSANTQQTSFDDVQPPAAQPPSRHSGTAARPRTPADKGLIAVVAAMFQTPGPAPQQPIQPVQPVQPTLPTPADQGNAPSTPTAELEKLTGMVEKQMAEYAQSTSQKQAQTQAATDSAGALSQTNHDVQNVTVQHRSPVSQDPYIRGLKGGQVYTQANGVYWTPARRDLDTMLSKIDPGMMQNVTVLPGPYGLRYGPGLAFIDVTRVPTPRYEDGFESHFDTTGNVRSNGGQLYGRETAYGGSDDWGFRMSYGDRAGHDYRAGSNLLIPSTYHNRDAWGELSFDVNPNRRLDIAYQRLDQTDTDYPCEFFNVDNLATYGLEGRMVDTTPSAPWSKCVIEGWYNRTGFRGSTPAPNDNFPVINRVNYALTQFYHDGSQYSLVGATQGIASSSGARLAATFGDVDETHINVGGDFRYLQQVIGEEYQQYRNGSTYKDPFYTNMPYSWMRDSGAFVEWAKPLTDAWTTTVGARVDYVNTTARISDLRSNSALDRRFLNGYDTLYAFYCSEEYKLDEHWTMTGGFGYGQRPTTLIERYADGLFISSLQSGFTRVIGNPQLKPERDWQVDLGVSVEQEKWRGKANCFHSWVLDYVTFDDDSVTDFTDAKLLRYVNTPVATLSGCELYGEFDLYPRMSPFGRVSYLYGRDQTLGAPLPAISPLDSVVGLRFHNTGKEEHWNVEVAARMVGTQTSPGAIRLHGQPEVVEEATGGFTTCYIRGSWTYRKNLRLIAGIDNVFNRAYQEHLDLRLNGPTGYQPINGTTRVLAPGISPYFGVNWIF